MCKKFSEKSLKKSKKHLQKGIEKILEKLARDSITFKKLDYLFFSTKEEYNDYLKNRKISNKG